MVNLVETLNFDFGNFDDEDQFGDSTVDSRKFDSLEGVESIGSSLNSSENISLETDSDFVFWASVFLGGSFLSSFLFVFHLNINI
jgi:hypothetical protein